MSRKETIRRQMLHHVMLESWRLYKKGLSVCYSWSSCLKLAWAKIRGRIHMFSTRVYGCSFLNDDGTKRQSILSYLSRFPRFMVGLWLTREPSNAYDPYAIKVEVMVKGSKHSLTLGYLKKELAAQVAPLIDSGKQAIARFDGITGGYNGKLYGCNFSYTILCQKEKAAH